MKTFETSGGKKIQMKIAPNTRHIKLEFSTGGELPEELSGYFTEEREAEIAITRYINKTPKQSKKDV